MRLEDMQPIVKRFYEGLEQGKLYGRRCLECGTIEFPPHIACNTCGYHATEWVEVAGTGTLLNFTLPGIQNDKPHLKAHGKYGYGTVQLDEGPTYTYVVYGLNKKNAEAVRRRIIDGQQVRVHAKTIDREGYQELVFELDDEA